MLLAAVGLLLMGCESATKPDTAKAVLSKEDVAHDLITAHLKKNLDDPASYQPASWSKPVAYRVADKAAWEKQFADSELEGRLRLLDMHVGSYNRFKGKRFGEKATAYYQAKIKSATKETDSLRLIATKLGEVKDTTLIGTVYTHVFRAKNKMGGLVLDSAQFLVTPDGKLARHRF